MLNDQQRISARQLQEAHHVATPLVLPNAWDAASARVYEAAGFQAIATTSSGVAATLGYPDGQRISRSMLLQVISNITRVITVPLSVDLEAGYGGHVNEIIQTVRSVLDAGAVGINIEDTSPANAENLNEIGAQVELLKAIRTTANSLDIPLVINARTDIYLLPGNGQTQFAEAVRRGQAYLHAGADCFYPIGLSHPATIRSLIQAIKGPLNILADSTTVSIPDLAQLGVARVSFGAGLMQATLGRLRRIAQELRTQGTYAMLGEDQLSGKDLDALTRE